MDELKADVDELERLLASATRSRVRTILESEVKKLQAEIINRVEPEKNTADTVEAPKKTKTVTRPCKVINTYAWDQTAKFMKLYVTINGVQDIDKSNVTSEFAERSFQLAVKDLDGVDYRIRISNLFEDVLPESCYHKVKTDTVLVMLKKSTEGTTWAYVTEKEKKAKDKSKPKVDESKDPNDSMMDMLKNMYAEGDDDMKRTIAKAMTESRNKAPDANLSS